jgi:lysophospholipase L1-like esterase
MSLSTCNLGISATLFTNNTALPNNGMDRYPSQVISRPYDDWFCFLYDTNDISAVIPASDWGADVNQMVVDLLSRGYNPRKIVLGTATYRQGNALAAELDAYKAQIVSICATHNLRLSDTLEAFRAYPGGGDLLMADTIHPNATGQTVLKDTFFAAMQGA